MKKLSCVAFTVAMLASCFGGKKETGTITCTTEQKSDDFTISQTIKFDCQDDNITKQDQKTVITVPDKRIYEAMLPTLKSASLENKAKGVEGMSYSLTEDRDKFSITEPVVFNIKEVDPKSYDTSTSQKPSGKKMVMDLERTEENTEKGELTCRKQSVHDMIHAGELSVGELFLFFFAQVHEK